MGSLVNPVIVGLIPPLHGGPGRRDGRQPRDRDGGSRAAMRNRSEPRAPENVKIGRGVRSARGRQISSRAASKDRPRGVKISGRQDRAIALYKINASADRGQGDLPLALAARALDRLASAVARNELLTATFGSARKSGRPRGRLFGSQLVTGPEARDCGGPSAGGIDVRGLIAAAASDRSPAQWRQARSLFR
jgi:hypothetical protein